MHSRASSLVIASRGSRVGVLRAQVNQWLPLTHPFLLSISFFLDVCLDLRLSAAAEYSTHSFDVQEVEKKTNQSLCVRDK